jgi:hypothetical protein
MWENNLENNLEVKEKTGRDGERERKDKEREGREKREREEGKTIEREGELERPGGNRTTPSKADHCQPEEETLHHHHSTKSGERRERERESSHRADLRALRHKKSKIIIERE